MATVYSYTTRPAEDTGNLLLEFLELPDGKNFIKQLIYALEAINIEVTNYDDLWMNDEIALEAVSDIGSFTIYRDVQGRYFITSVNNPKAIPLIDEILEKHIYYKRI
jgi:hypothetical protein